MKRLFTFCLCFATLVLASAQVPGTLSYQGILVNVAGNPVADGNHTVTFSFYKTATGGVPTFARGPFTVSTFKGLFTLVLGTGTPVNVNDPLPVIASDPNYIGGTQYYIELVADNVILSPRVALTSMPYAFTAQNANTMNASGLTGTVSDARLEPKVDITELTVGSSSQLAVNNAGNITKINNVVTSFPADQGAANTVLSNDGSGNLTWVSPATSTGGWGLSGNTGTAATNFLGTTDNQPLIFSTNTAGGGGERMRIGADGNVGIGGAPTNSTLNLKGNGTLLSLVGNDHAYLEFYPAGPSTRKGWIGYGSANDLKLSLANENAITFITSNGTTAGERMRIDENGNVGIGTTSPLGKLDVFGGPIAFGGTLNNTSTRPALSSAPISNEIWAHSWLSTADDGFLRVSAGGGTTAAAKSFIDISGFSTVDDMKSNIVFGTAGSERARIDVNGNLGIGTTIPASKLDVGGDVRLAQTTAPATTTDKLYNVGGNLYWSGVTISNGNTGTNHFFGYGAGLNNTTGNNNHFEGYSAGPSNTTGSFNYFSGNGAGNTNTTASGNHFSGIYTGFNNTTGASNYFSGYNAGNSNTTGSQNHFVGQGAGQSNTTATSNHFEGYIAGRSNTTGAGNLFIGSQAGRDNTTADENHFVGLYSGLLNTTGERNYFSGLAAGNANTTASENHFEGYKAGYFNTTGTRNYFSGYEAGLTNTTSPDNHFEGYKAGYANTTGSQNYFSGNGAGYSNTTGTNNYFSGYGAGFKNTTADLNHFAGWHAGFDNTTGTQNFFSGYSAGLTNTTGSNNTAIGYLADVSTGALTNATAIGNGAVVNASNKIRLGNASVTVIEGQVAFTAASDRRLKANIQDLNAGLDFIMKLRPVSYYMKNQVEPRTNWGFIAQEIESLVGHDNSILTIGGDNDRTLGLRYTDFVAPLVKAIQEQQKTIESQEEKIKQLEEKIGKLNGAFTAELDAIKKQLGMEVKSETSSTSGVNK